MSKCTGPVLPVALLFALSALGCGGSSLTAPGTGTLRITTATSGSELDPDGYTVQVDAGAAQPIGLTGSVQSTDLTPGNHTVHLAGLAPNCTVTGDNPQSITVTAGATADANFAISCSAVGGAAAKLVFVSDRSASRNHLFTVNADGTGLTELSRPGSDHTGPAWSPDGSRIVLVDGATDVTSTSSRIALMNADGSGARDLTTGAFDDEPVWSPDGRKIMFQRLVNNAFGEIYVMNADGTGQVNVTNDPQVYFGLAWSPAGDKIGFGTGSDGVFVANPDGSGLTRLADGLGPVWSPDGRRIAFVKVVNLVSDIWSMNADGSDQRQLTHTVLPPATSEGGAGAPAWSPDGQKIAFHSGRASPNSSYPDQLDLYVMNADGSNQTGLSADPAQAESSPRWSPDGSKIAFQQRNCCSGQFDPDVVVINADGTGRVSVSQNPAADYEFAWKP